MALNNPGMMSLRRSATSASFNNLGALGVAGADQAKEEGLAKQIGQLNKSTPLVPLRRLKTDWERRGAWRGFFLFLLTGTTWTILQHMRVDANFAYSTYRVYDLAEEVLQQTYGEIRWGFDLVTFMMGDMTRVLDAMAATHNLSVCPDCAVGLTTQPGDMFSLELSDFICSDFESTSGSMDYPRRDCAAANEAWALAPSVSDAPCCSNNTLAELSLLLMVVYGAGGNASLSYAELQLLNQQEVVRRLTFAEWTKAQISPGTVPGGSDETDHLIQLIISRDERMAGVGFKAKFLDEVWFPNVVETWSEIWSQRYDRTDWLAIGLFSFFLFVDALHEGLDVFYEFRLLRVTAKATGFRGDVMRSYLLSNHVLFLLLVELPTIVLPVWLEILRARGMLDVIEFNLIVAVTLAFMLARIFVEGQVIPAFQLLVLTITKAAGQLTNFLIIMLLMIVCAAEMHMTIFGVYTDSYESMGEAFLFTFEHFAIGQELDLNGGEKKNSPLGYVFLYIFSSLLLLLVLSQFFIAILVSAWDSAEEVKQTIREASALPPGFNRRREERSLARVVLEHVVFFMTGYSIDARATGVHIHHALGHCLLTLEWSIRKRLAKCAAAQSDGGENLISEEQEKEQFLLEHGLVDRKDVQVRLMEAGLSSWTAEYVMDAYLPPGLSGRRRSIVAMGSERTTGVDDVINRLKNVTSADLEKLTAEEDAARRAKEDHATLMRSVVNMQAVAADVSEMKSALTVLSEMKSALTEQRAAIDLLASKYEAVDSEPTGVQLAPARHEGAAPDAPDSRSAPSSQQHLEKRKHRRSKPRGNETEVTTTTTTTATAMSVFTPEQALHESLSDVER